MGKSDTTKKIESDFIRNERNRQLRYCSQEVSIDFKQYGSSRFIDILVYDGIDDIFIPHEIKISKSDFNSKSGHNFVGDKNYYIVPTELVDYAKEKTRGDKHIGVIEAELVRSGHYWFTIRKHSKNSKNKIDFAMRSLLMFNLMKALYREKSKIESARYYNELMNQ